MSTVVTKKASDIIAHLARVRPLISAHIPLFTLSATADTDPGELSGLVSQLQSLSDRSVGCLSAPIPSRSDSFNGAFACSLAIFDFARATSFRSNIPGRPITQVGRWHAFRKDTTRTTEAEKLGSALGGTDLWSLRMNSRSLPVELQALERADTIDTVVYFTDGSSEGLVDAFRFFPSATSVGLVATSTPFVTGRPYTLFHGSAVHSSGAVGVCLNSPKQPTFHTNFPGLQALTKAMFVTESEGNLIHSLDNMNPTRLLLSAIQQRNGQPGSDGQSGSALDFQLITKDDLFFVGTIRDNGSDSEASVFQLYHITSGDPSRGTFAIESEFAPTPGMLVQLYHLPRGSVPDVLSRYLPASFSSPASRKMSFSMSPPDVLSLDEISEVGPETIVIDDTFLVASENGVVIGRQGGDPSTRERPWTCKVPGGEIDLRWALR
ncbi:uncharacterized protein FIBRA_02659 [Fibroporia radiculosa]|uniref:FIST domain-containing protein n=1 Tax=Fibroporia radiculosa TaxID=599839 RepID=J4G287_9APHY|nr:uncharacterized protein FIBRA_02659 [Fibroporia radiculosa]CCM00623.1 predicted protein [Fibroporia radiculosa]